MTSYRITFDNTGHIRPRSLPRQDAARVGRQLLERQAQIRAALPQAFSTALDPHLAILTADVPVLEQNAFLQPQSPHNPIPTSEAVRALIQAPVELTNTVMFNHLIDRYVRAADDCLRASGVGNPSNPRVAAATTLRERLFSNGRAFLSLSNLRQWHHIHFHFNNMAEEDLALADLAGARQIIDAIQVLNAHFALMLGVDLDNLEEVLEDNPELDDNPNNDIPATHTRILETLTAMLTLTHFLWPGTDQATERARVIGPFLDELERHAAARRRPTPTPPQNDPPTNPSPLPA